MVPVCAKGKTSGHFFKKKVCKFTLAASIFAQVKLKKSLALFMIFENTL